MKPSSVDIDPVLKSIEQFLDLTGMNATSFGSISIKDPCLVHELRNGRELRKATRARIGAYIHTALVHKGLA